jgi:hypothetical protein
MGYANSLPYQHIIIQSDTNEVVIGNAAADHNIQTLDIPDFKNPISYATMDTIIQGYKEESGSLNYFQNVGNCGLKDTGGTFHIANDLRTWNIQCNASATNMCYVVLPGVDDLHAYITPGATQQALFYGVRALADSFHLYGVYVRLNLYFAI